MANQYSGFYICNKCNWKSDIFNFGYLHGWDLKQDKKKMVKHYEAVFGKDYLKKEFYVPFYNEDFEDSKFESNLLEAKEMYSEENIKIIDNKKILIKYNVKGYILERINPWRVPINWQCKKCFYIYSGISDIVESIKCGISKKRCPKCKVYGEEIKSPNTVLFCPKCKSKSLKFHHKRTLTV